VGIFDGDAYSMVHLLLDFNFRHPQIVIDDNLDDKHYDRQFSATRFCMEGWVLKKLKERTQVKRFM
jgi:hypothetical protein